MATIAPPRPTGAHPPRPPRCGARPRLSAELFTVPLEEGAYLVYAPLRRAAFIGNAGTVNFLAALSRSEWPENADPDGSLVEFLRRLEILDAGPELQPVEHRSGEPEPTSVTLFLTTACNLRCTYCYASAGETPQKFMSLETCVRGIDFVAENARRRGSDRFGVIYHGGGEPTVNWTVMTDSWAHALRRAEELGIRASGSLGTNGVLRDRQIDWIARHLTGATLSCDGLPEVHDRNRLTVLGSGSSERVAHTMRRFDEAGFRYSVRMTLTAEHVARLPDSVEYLYRDFRPQSVQVEPVYGLGRGRQAASAEAEAFLAAFREARGRARRHGRELLYSAARAGTVTSHFCGITRDSFALSPDGGVSACFECFSEESEHAGVFFYGKPAEGERGYRFDLPVLDNLRRQTVDNRDYCRGCFARWSCAGDCYHKAISAYGDGEFAGTERCHVTRELTKDQILEKIAAAGGLFWHEAPGPHGREATA